MTRVFKVPPRDVDPRLLREPAEILRSGGVVAFPTETVYGLGASSGIPGAVSKLAQLKGRPEGKPFSYHVASVAAIDDLVDNVPPLARKLMNRYCPGPITLVLSTGEGSERRRIGVRVPANEIAQKLISLAGAPLLVPSANPADEPPAICAEDVMRYFGDEIEGLVDGGTTLLKQASTVVLVDREGYQVLREGFITKEMIHQLLAGRRILFVCTGNTCRSPIAAALYRKLLAERFGKSPDDLREHGYRITSAGTFVAAGDGASEDAVTALREYGCDLPHHTPRQVTTEMLAEVDRVYALSHSHFNVLEKMIDEIEPAKRPRLEMLSSDGVNDPVGAGLEAYRACVREIEAALLDILPR